MRANSISLQKIFEPTIRYRIPLFQRPYVWTEEDNWIPIWEDVRSLSERYLRDKVAPPHFLGAVVLDQMRGPTGSIEVRQVIDGQQRMTTLQVLFAVLRDLAVQHEQKRYADRFTKLTANDASFRDEPDDEFKVWPTNRDRDDFRTVMTAGTPNALRVAYGAASGKKRLGIRMADAYLYFHGEISTWLEHDGGVEDLEVPLGGSLEERMEALWHVLQGRIYMVAMDLEENDDAQIIFETLNARGTRLLPADLVKNYLFHRAELEHADIEALYRTYWQHFDEEFWRTEVRQGRLKRPRIDLFLQHYLTLKTYDEVNVGHIFGVFRQYAESDGRASLNAQSLLESLTTYGKVYRRFQEPPAGTRSALFFERLDAIDTATVYPFLLEVFRTYDSPDAQTTLTQILTDLESFLVRRMLCNLTTKSYNRLFVELVKDAEKEGSVTLAGLRSSLLRLNNESVRWPNDEEFSAAFLSTPLYKTLSAKKLSMVLSALDHAFESDKSETVTVSSGLTIEHLMPQGWHVHWPLILDDEPDPIELQHHRDARVAAVQTMGNLTLVTGKLNPSLSNGPWETKRPEILKHSKLNLNRYFQEVDTWDEARIAKRGQLLLQAALRIWPYPQDIVTATAPN